MRQHTNTDVEPLFRERTNFFEFLASSCAKQQTQGGQVPTFVFWLKNDVGTWCDLAIAQPCEGGEDKKTQGCVLPVLAHIHCLGRVRRRF